MATKKRKRCKSCGRLFKPYQTTQQACSVQCALDLAKKRDEKQQRRIDYHNFKLRKERLLSRSEWVARVQTVFNNYIRLRDAGRGCISCGSRTARRYNAGHYRTVKAAPELRFDEDNCHLQCAQCNNFDSGNIVEYRINLEERIGSERLARLENYEASRDPMKKNYTIDELKELIEHYKMKIKELKQSREDNE